MHIRVLLRICRCLARSAFFIPDWVLDIRKLGLERKSFQGTIGRFVVLILLSLASSTKVNMPSRY